MKWSNEPVSRFHPTYHTPNTLLDGGASIDRAWCDDENRSTIHASSSEHPLLPFVHARPAATRHAPDLAIERYLHADGLGELYVYALERMERLCSRAITSELLSLLWASRRGLTQQELVAITGRREHVLARTIDTITHHLLWRGEMMSLSSTLRDAVEERYLRREEERRRVRMKIAEHFANAPLDARRLEEEPWQLHEAGAWSALTETLAQPAFAHALYESGGKADLLRYWNAIGRRRDIAMMYEAALEAYRRNDRECLAAAELYRLLGELYIERREEEKGEGLLRRSFAIRLAVLGDDDPMTLDMSHTLNAIHQTGSTTAGGSSVLAELLLQEVPSALPRGRFHVAPGVDTKRMA